MHGFRIFYKVAKKWHSVYPVGSDSCCRTTLSFIQGLSCTIPVTNPSGVPDGLGGRVTVLLSIVDIRCV